jgi:oxygen-independent coproporphyrinogen-3 oxidase
MPVGLYIHVPFCHTRCHFCAFYLQIYRKDRAETYLASLEREIRLHAEKDSLGGRPLTTVYFGGGTPTTLLADQLCHVLKLVHLSFGLEENAEVTVEAHPDTVTAGDLEQLLHAGFNRISFGVQSMDDHELIHIGRRTTGHAASLAVEASRTAGFRDLNLDLIYGLPGQTMESWTTSLEETIQLDPDHLSCYALTVEEHSHLRIGLNRGNLKEPDPEAQVDMEDTAFHTLTAAGFERYEISNYCRADHGCRHNLLYWQGDDYLGLGPSAQSYVSGVRFGNVDDLGAYHRCLEAGGLPITESEHLTAKQRRREAVVFGLRLTAGVDRQLIEAVGPDSAWRQTLNRLTRQGLLDERSGRIRLTEEGRRLADSVAVALL